MPKYKLIVDSSCDLPYEFFEKYNISVTNLLINFNDRVYADRKDITPKEILEKYESSHIVPKTAALNIEELSAAFKPELEQYDHIFYMPISSRISSTFNNARLAAQSLDAENKITCLDSSELSSGTALLALGIIKDFEENLTPEEIVSNHNERVKRIDMSFVFGQMELLYKGGRCSGLTYLLGNKFHIHPIISLEKGKMGVKTLVRGKDITKGIKKMLEFFDKQFENNNIDLDYPIFVPHVTGDKGVEIVIHHLQKMVGRDIIFPVEASGIIVCHCGGDTVGLAYMLKRPA